MIENLHVTLNIQKNNQEEIEVNGYNRRTLINNNFLGLSFYEQVCQPRQITDIEQVSFEYLKIDRIIKEILRCNICLQIFYEPVNIKSCLHKFCKKCIEDYNRRIKKECALCRHPIETRRLMREDGKMKDIIKCLIPSIEKFNEVEEKIITNYLPNFCFKDSVQKQQQQEKFDKLEGGVESGMPIILSDSIAIGGGSTSANPSVSGLSGNVVSNLSTNGVSNSSNSVNNISNINTANNILSVPNKELLQRKKRRNSNAPISANCAVTSRSGRRNKNNVIAPEIIGGSTLKKKETEAESVQENKTGIMTNEETHTIQSTNNGQTVGVKLICDSPNEEVKKYFSKTKLYTNEDISLDYVSKYICFKQNYSSFHKDRISFYMCDEEKNKYPLEKNCSLKQIRQNFKISDGELIKLYFMINQ